MFLEKAGREVGDDGAVEGALDCGGLAFPPSQECNAFCIEDGGAAHGDGASGNLLFFGKVNGVVVACLFAEIHNAGSRVAGGAWFVESDVAVGANAEDLEVDPTSFDDGGFIGATIGIEVRVSNGAVRDVDVVGEDVDVIEELLMHELPVAVWIGAIQAKVFVEVEGGDRSEGKLSCGMEFAERFVKLDGGATSGEAENCGEALGLPGLDERDDIQGQCLRGGGGVWEYLGGRGGGLVHGRGRTLRQKGQIWAQVFLNKSVEGSVKRQSWGIIGDQESLVSCRRTPCRISSSLNGAATVVSHFSRRNQVR